MDCEYRDRLDAFHDGALPEDALREIRCHLETCPSCAAELAEIKLLSREFAEIAPEKMSPLSLARAHAAADAKASEMSPPILRAAGLLGGVAASILLIASAWLRDSPPDNVQLLHVAVVSPPEWERIAVTLDAGPWGGEASDVRDQQMLANADSADARVAEWMLQDLSR